MRIAVSQCTSLPRDVSGNLERLEQTAALAADRGAEVLILPEMFLTGYDIGATAAADLAEPSDGTMVQAVAGVARAHGLAVVTGYPERDGARVYNSAIFVDEGGELLGVHRKAHLFGGLDRAMFSPADAMPSVFDWHGWNVGMLICYDLEFPEMCRSLAVAGADLVCVPTANMVEYDAVPTTLVPARAYENQLYVAYANYCGTEGTLRYGGLSTIAGPDAPIARAGRSPELLICDLDRDRLALSRAQNPYLPNRRPDLY